MSTPADDFASRAMAALLCRWPDLAALPEAELKHILAGSWLAFDAVSRRGYAPRTGGFRPPTEAEVKSFLEEIGYDIDPGAFIDFYAQKGWKVGRGNTPMVNWKSAARLWKRGGWGKSETPTRHPQQGAASLGALQLQLDRVRQEIRNIKNPGGSAWPRPLSALSNDEMVRLASLEGQRGRLTESIENFGA